MRVKSGQPLIPLEKIESFLQLEPSFVIIGMAIASFLIYKIFLRKVSKERHKSLKNHFKNLAFHSAIWLSSFGLYYSIDLFQWFSENTSSHVAGYVGLLTLVTGAIVFVKASRLLVLEYLFFGHMKEGVPILLVNLFTLLVSLCLVGWFTTEVFGVQLTPLLATSAVFSLILGLALQETLGNLFAGIALQLDKPFEIGDWVEMQVGLQKWAGQVYEITWRATLLTGMDDERLIVPNRLVATAQVTNFTVTRIPIIRALTLKFPHDCDIEKARTTLARAARAISRVSQNPAPSALLSETTDSWISCKLLYYIENYGDQADIANEVLTSVLNSLKKSDIPLASPHIRVEKT